MTEDFKSYLDWIVEKIDDSKILSAKSLIRQMSEGLMVDDFKQVEFKVFSQFGDDGIIQYLIRRVDIPDDSRRFVEFGVGNYREANTRFLLKNDDWTGLVIDRNKFDIDSIRRDSIHWRHDLTAVQATLDRDNINSLIASAGFEGEIGVLSVDIDGNDFWVWQSLSVVNPVIAIVEFNSVFGCRHAITVPYDARFDRAKAHPSWLFWGSSIKALCLLAEQKGYAFVGSNSNGNNAYFVRRDKIGKLKTFSAKDGYVLSKFRDSRDGRGRLSYLGGPERLRAIEEMRVYDLESNREIRLKDLFPL